MILLNILGTILKIIGILLLCILLLLVFLLLVLLFVPIRYRADISRTGGDIGVRAQVSYLFRLIKLPVSIENGKRKVRLSAFGVTLFSNEEGAKKRRRKKKKVKSKEQTAQENTPQGEITQENTPQGETTQEKAERHSETEEGDEIAQMPETATVAESGNPMEAGVAATKKACRAEGENDSVTETGPQTGSAEKADAEESEAEETQGAANAAETPEEAKEPRGIFRIADRIVKLCRRLADKIKALFEKIAAFAGKVKNTLQTLKEKLWAGEAKLSDIKEKIQLILAFLRDEENKNGIKYAGKSILRLLKHVFPYKIEGDIVFATGDPYSLGQALSVLGMLYPLYGKNFSIAADFASDAFRLEGRVKLKGRIRLISILRIAWKLWREGRLKQLLLNGKKLKRELTAQA